MLKVKDFQCDTQHSCGVRLKKDKLIWDESQNNERDSFGDLYIYFSNPQIFM